MNFDVTPEEKTAVIMTDLQQKYVFPPPENPNHCMDCPYPGVGFICWSMDGSCLKTDMVKYSSLSDGR